MKLFIVDKQALFREGLIWMFENQSDIWVVGHARTGEEAIEKVAALQPDVMLLENNLLDGPGYTFIPSILFQSPKTKIIVLAQTDKEQFLMEAICCGADSHLSKEVSFPTLLSSLKTLAQTNLNDNGRVPGDPCEGFVDNPGRDLELAPLNPTHLTSRELQILQYLGKGSTNKEIADLLNISISTVKVNIRSIYSKLGLKNRREARNFFCKQDLMKERGG